MFREYRRRFEFSSACAPKNIPSGVAAAVVVTLGGHFRERPTYVSLPFKASGRKIVALAFFVEPSSRCLYADAPENAEH